eukprot:2243578-Pleurochrysis_carterae.AAC.3
MPSDVSSLSAWHQQQLLPTLASMPARAALVERLHAPDPLAPVPARRGAAAPKVRSLITSFRKLLRSTPV